MATLTQYDLAMNLYDYIKTNKSINYDEYKYDGKPYIALFISAMKNDIDTGNKLHQIFDISFVHVHDDVYCKIGIDNSSLHEQPVRNYIDCQTIENFKLKNIKLTITYEDLYKYIFQLPLTETERFELYYNLIIKYKYKLAVELFKDDVDTFINTILIKRITHPSNDFAAVLNGREPSKYECRFSTTYTFGDFIIECHKQHKNFNIDNTIPILKLCKGDMELNKKLELLDNYDDRIKQIL